MSELPPTDAPAVAPDAETENAPVLELPRWVAPVIGLVLVGLAGIAIYTGWYHRPAALGRVLITKSKEKVWNARKDPVQESGGAPGEPEPGASRVVHGSSGEAVPPANPLPEGQSSPRITISNEGASIPSIRMSVRRGISFEVVPDEAMVFINEHPIGSASQFKTADQAYEFASEGSFTVRLVFPGYSEAEFVVNADVEAAQETATITARLEPLGKK